MILFYSQVNWGIESFSNLLKIMYLSIRAYVQSQVHSLPEAIQLFLQQPLSLELIPLKLQTENML